jgi:hypothetical protein
VVPQEAAGRRVMTVQVGNRTLAARCTAMASRGGPDRPAWLCLAICYGTTRTTRTARAARQALDLIPGDHVRDRAAQLLGDLDRQDTA